MSDRIVTDITARPEVGELHASISRRIVQLLARHGAYPATEHIYDFAWPSAERCRRSGDALTNAVAARARVARWLLCERFPDWDLALIGVSEAVTMAVASPSWAPIVSFSLLILMLLLRPGRAWR